MSASNPNNPNNLYRGLFELLAVPGGTAAAMIALAATRPSRRELLNVARKEDCLPEVYARWDAEGQLSPAESVEHDQLVRQRASAADVLRVLPAGTLLVGAVGPRRGSGTLEVLLPDFAAVGALHEAVSRLGYRLRSTGDCFVQMDDPMHRGVATLRYAMSPLAEGAVAIEVQVAGVPVDARRNLPFTELAERATRLDGLACRALEPTRELLRRIVAFGARSAPVTVREIADLHALLSAPAVRIDHAWLQRKVELLKTWTGLRQIREAIVAKRLGASLSWGEFGRLIELGAARAEAGAAPGARTPRVGALLKNAFDLCHGAREDDLVAKLARNPAIVFGVLGAGYRVRAVPVSTKSYDAPRFLRIDGGLYLATGAGLMLLSLVDLREGARSALGERVRTGGRPVVLARWTTSRARAGTR